MKRILLTFLLLSNISFAQINVYEPTKKIKIGNVQNYATIEMLDDIYTVCYDDIKFTKIVSVKCFDFKNINNDFDNLFNMIIKGFDDKKEQTINLNLPNDLVDLKFVKNMGIISFQFTVVNKNTQILSLSPYLSKKQVYKLFGKNLK